MIELIRIEPAGERALDLTFSNGATGRWEADALITRDTVLTRPLEDPAYFVRAFIEAAALTWPIGLEFSAHALHAHLRDTGNLVQLEREPPIKGKSH